MQSQYCSKKSDGIILVDTIKNLYISIKPKKKTKKKSKKDQLLVIMQMNFLVKYNRLVMPLIGDMAYTIFSFSNNLEK